MNALKALIAVVALFWGSAQAAYIGTSTCNDPSGCGYYLSYEGLLAGFVKWEVGGVPALAMSIDPTVYAPTAPGTPVTLFSYDQVMAAGSGFTVEEQVKLSQISHMVNYMFSVWMAFGGDFVSPPTVCSVGIGNCNAGSAEVNTVAWNIWDPNTPVPLSSAGTQELANLTSGSYDQRDWTTDMLLMQISGGDTFIIPLGETSPQALMTQTPIPASAWLFGSGLFGLVAVSRRRNWA